MKYESAVSTADEDVKFRVAFTGIPPLHYRVDKWVWDNGGEVLDNVTASVDVLITSVTDTNTIKMTKARDIGVPIVNVDEAEEYIKQRFLSIN